MIMTCLIDCVLLVQDVVDRACKDKGNKEFDPDFKLELFLDKVCASFPHYLAERGP